MGLWSSFIAIIVVRIDDASVGWPAYLWWCGLVALVGAAYARPTCCAGASCRREEAQTSEPDTSTGSLDAVHAVAGGPERRRRRLHQPPRRAAHQVHDAGQGVLQRPLVRPPSSPRLQHRASRSWGRPRQRAARDGAARRVACTGRCHRRVDHARIPGAGSRESRRRRCTLAGHDSGGDRFSRRCGDRRATCSAGSSTARSRAHSRCS